MNTIAAHDWKALPFEFAPHLCLNADIAWAHDAPYLFGPTCNDRGPGHVRMKP
jgi:hypothetical protein